MRVTTLFKRPLRLGRERVVGVESCDDDEGERLVIDLARPERRLMHCPGCEYRTRAVYDRTMRTWRHLDALRTRVQPRCEVRRMLERVVAEHDGATGRDRLDGLRLVGIDDVNRPRVYPKSRNSIARVIRDRRHPCRPLALVVAARERAAVLEQPAGSEPPPTAP